MIIVTTNQVGWLTANKFAIPDKVKMTPAINGGTGEFERLIILIDSPAKNEPTNQPIITKSRKPIGGVKLPSADFANGKTE